jgi:hypothetical protein
MPTTAIPNSTCYSSSRRANATAARRYLEKMQQLIHERALFTPIWQLAAHAGVDPKVAESGLGLIRRYPFSAPHEDAALKGE